ncbi:hypothetical protein MMO38_11590 [Acinetobacter sp. NIPH 1852]|uniref:hypothetical protein n=1 Tax=Acinetobacter sp. NIPH 1852 TaxID=2923428 RepID=UPI001F4ACA5D|nr:hypothetical protein [Acinetobacter sp. NIPH 1852]MCH7308770.1 hypothetical protein [Acinetobacter sp. NIPH 1852]
MKIQYLSIFLLLSILFSGCINQAPIKFFTTPVLIINKSRNNISMLSSVHSSLYVDKNGCIRLGNDSGPLIIWHHDSKLENSFDGKITIIEGFTGKSIFIGDQITLSGGLHDLEPTNVTPIIPKTCSNHGYWISGQLKK